MIRTPGEGQRSPGGAFREEFPSKKKKKATSAPPRSCHPPMSPRIKARVQGPVPGLSGRVPALQGRGWGQGRAVPAVPPPRARACPVSPRALALSQCGDTWQDRLRGARADVTGTRSCHLTPGPVLLLLLTQPAVPRRVTFPGFGTPRAQSCPRVLWELSSRSPLPPLIPPLG